MHRRDAAVIMVGASEGIGAAAAAAGGFASGAWTA